MEAIKATSKALGPDNIAPIMIKKVGPTDTSYITDLMNLTMKTNIRKVSRIIPILKPGNPSDRGESYRPISLLLP